MIQISVALPNGHAELLTLPPSSTVQDVRTKAQRAFGKKCLRLISAKNRVLVDFEQTLEEAEIEDSEWLTALVLQPQLAATENAFALWCHKNRAIVAWGDADFGGDNSAVQEQLNCKGVQQIQATNAAFAVILEDGAVVTWSHGGFGGDCLVQLCIPKWQSPRSYTYTQKGSQRSKSSNKFLLLLLPCDPFRAGLLKKMGQPQMRPAQIVFFETCPTQKSPYNILQE